MSVVTVDELKAKLGLPPAPDPVLDTRLQSMIDETQVLVEGYLGVPIEPTEMVTERATGLNGSGAFMLPVWPVISLDMVTVAGVEQDLATFWLESDTGMVHPTDGCGCRRGGCFCCAPGPLHVEYTAGFEPVPADLQLALLNLSAEYYQANAGSSGQVVGGGGDRVKQVTIFGAMSIGFDSGSSASSSSGSTSGLEVPGFLSGWTWVLDKYQVRELIVE